MTNEQDEIRLLMELLEQKRYKSELPRLLSTSGFVLGPNDGISFWRRMNRRQISWLGCAASVRLLFEDDTLIYDRLAVRLTDGKTFDEDALVAKFWEAIEYVSAYAGPCETLASEDNKPGASGVAEWKGDWLRAKLVYRFHGADRGLELHAWRIDPPVPPPLSPFIQLVDC